MRILQSNEFEAEICRDLYEHGAVSENGDYSKVLSTYAFAIEYQTQPLPEGEDEATNDHKCHFYIPTNCGWTGNGILEIERSTPNKSLTTIITFLKVDIEDLIDAIRKHIATQSMLFKGKEPITGIVMVNVARLQTHRNPETLKIRF